MAVNLCSLAHTYGYEYVVHICILARLTWMNKFFFSQVIAIFYFGCFCSCCFFCKLHLVTQICELICAHAQPIRSLLKTYLCVVLLQQINTDKCCLLKLKVLFFQLKLSWFICYWNYRHYVYDFKDLKAPINHLSF